MTWEFVYVTSQIKKSVWIFSCLQIEGKPTSATVSYAQAKAMAQSLGAHTYCESSAKNMTGLKKVFEEAAAAGLQHAFPGGLDKHSSCAVS